jgi:hypothetical protein
MSVAVPEVRRHFTELLREQVEFGADGAHLVFNRGYPLVLYEESASDIFREKHGIDPHEIDEPDPRIAAWRNDIVTGFMSEIREMLDSCDHPGTERPRFSITVLGTEADNLQYGLDIRRLIDERIIDEIFVYKWGFGNKRFAYDLDFFKEICLPKAIPFSPTTAPYFHPDYYTFPLIESFYDIGAAGVMVWDAEVLDIYDWSVISRFGHEDETKWRFTEMKKVNGEITKPPHKYLEFHKMSTNVLDGRYKIYWGG